MQEQTNAEPTPYAAVATCGTIIFACGWISIAAGAVAILVAFGGDSTEGASLKLLDGIWLAFAGVFQLGAGSLIHMLRDTAIHIQSK